MATPDFVHLHVHSEYSLLDGASSVENLLKTAKAFGMPALAVTDHGSLFGIVDFYKRALQLGVKPVLGYEAYIAPGSRTDRDSKGIREASFHLTLLARNNTGLRNLYKLATTAHREGFYYHPRIDKQLLAAHADGLIGLSGCLHSEISHLILADEFPQACAMAGQYADIFGKDNFFIELQDHGLNEQKRVLRKSVEVAHGVGLQTVATNDVHYVARDDARVHDILLCIATGKMVSDEDRMKYSTNEFYLKSPDEMADVFSAVPESVRNTAEIARRCNVEMSFNETHLPPFTPPDGLTAAEYLRRLCLDGLRARYGADADKHVERLNFELATIERMGFSNYFLIVWDLIRFAKTSGVPVGPGRGSAAGCLVSYCIGITEIDPIKYGLLFERFLNPGRVEMPDIDVDFCKIGRARVLEYVRQKYGWGNVAQVVTFGTLKARAAVRDVGRVLGVPLSVVDAIAKKIPMGDAAHPVKLKEVLNADASLRNEAEANPTIKELFNIACKVEGLRRHASTHAAAVVIADRDLTEYLPLFVNKGVETTQYDMNCVKDLGLLKIDLLALQTLTSLDLAVRLIERHRGIKIDLLNLPLDDGPAFDLLCRADVTGVFQLESSGGMRDVVKKLQPRKFEDLVALLALYRPGTIQSGIIESFIRIKHKLEEVSYLDKKLVPVLEETNGMMLYQEQVMMVANVVGGFSLTEADELRKAMSKKKRELLANYRPKFVEGAQKRGTSRDVAEQLFDQMEHFAGYGFNKSHSTAYALICYQTAYLKANYTREFMAAVLTTESEKTDKVAELIEECKRQKIPVLPPDVNESGADFTVVPDGIRFGLAAVKGIGDKTVNAIVEARMKHGPFRSLYRFCELVDTQYINKTVVEQLIKCGAFDSLKARRSALLEIAEKALQLGSTKQRETRSGQGFLFGGDKASTDDALAYPPLPPIEELPQDKLLAGEKEALGFYITSHPLLDHMDTVEAFSTATVAAVAGRVPNEGAEVVVGGQLSDFSTVLIRTGSSKNQKMVKFKIRDLSSSVAGIVFPGEAEKYRQFLVNDRIAFVRGKVDFRREEPTVKVSEVVPIENAREAFTGSLTVVLSGAGIDMALLERLKRIFDAHPGPCTVFIMFENTEGKKIMFKTSGRMMVSPSAAFVKDVEELLGKGRLRFHRRT
ncbi:MAG: DNA polymerase III subunit alpha [Planctomycetota bacterium]|nr:DNA polymerase III subunit alpha [Planctomycetota bacterium]